MINKCSCQETHEVRKLEKGSEMCNVERLAVVVVRGYRGPNVKKVNVENKKTKLEIRPGTRLTALAIFFLTFFYFFFIFLLFLRFFSFYGRCAVECATIINFSD